MRKNRRKEIEIFNLSFLDVISCGFGAIILLLVISKISQPLFIKEKTIDLSTQLISLEQQLEILQQKIKETNNKKLSTDENIKRLTAQEQLEKESIKDLQGAYKDSKNSLMAQKIIKKKLRQTYQTLSEEMQRLQENKLVINKKNTVGGITVDSEYIIFIIDTSGSMRNYAWPLVRKKMKEILAIHPNVKGIQVMNDMGDYMFSQYAGRWINDSPARRRSILKRLSSWQPFSNSSPEEGITRAIRHFYDKDKAIALFVFGDDFSRGSIQSVVETVDRLNKNKHSGAKRVRINAVGFPVLFQQPGNEMNIARFSALMRKLAENNNGSFVGLSHIK